jgi:two-component system, OmpR family, sensor histidine kinase TctE
VLATEIIKGVMVPQFVILPLAVLLVWLALVRGIRPLNELEQRIRARKPDDLSPLEESAVPQEVAPLVASVNDLLTAAEGLARHQRRFPGRRRAPAQDAAGGLCACRPTWRSAKAPTPRSSSSRCKQIGRSSVRATHTVNQLLALARAETTGRTLPSARSTWPNW